MRPLAILTLLAASACAAPSFVANTGRVAPKGAFRAGFGSGYQVNTQAAAIVRDGRDLAENLRSKATACPDGSGSCWNAADVEPVVDAAFRFALVAPLSSHTEVSARYGFAPGFDGGIHWGPDSKGLDLGWQAFGPRDPGTDGWAGTLLAGWGTRDLGTFGDVIENVLHGDAGLTDFQLAFVAGRQWREIAHTYVGARYTLTRWKVQVIPDLPIVYDGGAAQERLLGTDSTGFVHTTGGVFGGALGYKHVFVGAELNLLYTAGKADVFFKERDLGAFGVMPAVYIYGQY
ncbi:MULTISPECIES: hypothetical protein [Anaeromyxobacter]|uniref:hypothetical protein n=1 Tax=Anaeromyxobacter TaxID=161492 RepID=UPI001F587472|nr:MULTISPECIES: hypothetical protein [unclassified Anaeromyxobacter]